VREAPIETEENKEEFEVKESYKSRKELKKEDARAEKYNKKDKTKQAREELYVSKEKRKLKEQEGTACKKTKADERKQKRQVVEEDLEAEPVESSEAESTGEENLSCSPQSYAETHEVDVASVPSKKSSHVNKNIVEEEISEEEPDVLEDEESNDDNIPAKKCYYK
jgi:hypothetical protein